MAKDLALKHHRGTPSDVAEILKKPISAPRRTPQSWRRCAGTPRWPS